MISICKYFKLSRYKGFEIQFEFLTRLSSEWLRLNLETRSKTDHPGIYFELTLLKLFSLIFNFYDSRHWDYDNNKFLNSTPILE